MIVTLEIWRELRIGKNKMEENEDKEISLFS